MHKSVLLEECLTAMNLRTNSVIVDCTLGYGGHSSAVLKQIPEGFLYAFDQDPQAIAASRKRLSEIGQNFEIIDTNFVHIKEELQKRNIDKVDGILFDLGVSSPQLDEGERGFSFHQDAQLDMRMDPRRDLSAYTVVNTYSEADLARIFFDYGEEKYARSIAREIVAERSKKPIVTTLELVEVIKRGVPFKYRKEKHPARKVFQAIRIEVNRELEVLEQALWQALDLVKVGGRVEVITFHSLEDRIVKKIFKKVTGIPKELETLPVVPEQFLPPFKIIGNFEPSREEEAENSRARSAKLRVIERIRG